MREGKVPAEVGVFHVEHYGNSGPKRELFHVEHKLLSPDMGKVPGLERRKRKQIIRQIPERITEVFH
jgi:hypothetical protein